MPKITLNSPVLWAPNPKRQGNRQTGLFYVFSMIYCRELLIYLRTYV